MNHTFSFRNFWTHPVTLYFYFLTVLMVPNCFLLYTEPFSIWAGFTHILLPLSGYMAILIIWRKPGISLWLLFLFMILGAFQLVLLYLFDRSVIAPDMFINVVTTNSTEAGELLGKLTPAIIGVCLLYIPPLIFGILSIRSNQGLTRHFRLRTLFCAVLLGLVGTGTAYLARRADSDFRISHDVYPINVINNMNFAAHSWQLANEYPRTSHSFTFGAHSTHDTTRREIYVLVIGETTRAANWQLFGYNRETTPQLCKMERLIPIRDALTQSNTTHKSVPMILSAASAENFDCIYRQKSLITAFREAGFRTAFFSNQCPNRSFIDYFAQEADRHENLQRHSESDQSNALDMELLPLVDEELAQHARKQLLVLHTHGSHFNYKERYPDSSSFFTPDEIVSIRTSERTPLVNAFDNTIRYTDAFLAALIARIEVTGATAMVFYTSDHGEDLLDDSRNHFLHSSPIPSYYQMHIPILLWYSDAYASAFPKEIAAAHLNATYPVSTNIVFHTMLHAGGIATPFRNNRLALTAPDFEPGGRTWLGPYNDPVPVEDLHLPEEDLNAFQQHGLSFP